MKTSLYPNRRIFQLCFHFWSCDFVVIICLLALPIAMQSQSYSNTASIYNVSAVPDVIEFGSGVSFYDFNNDGWDDLSFTMPNDSLIFYLNTGTGFELQPSFAYADGLSKHLLWVDYDNDGDLDFIVSFFNGPYRLFQNDGALNFTDVSAFAGLPDVNERHYGISFGDYDKDGNLDFYVCTYALNEGTQPYYATNHLYHNNGDGTFTDVTAAAGVGDGIALSFQGVWIDYDNDGWLDLFIINDRIYANSLYKNNGDGTFSDVSEDAGIEFAGQDPMSATVSDFDNDGDIDIFFSNTGITNKLPKLLVNNGDGTFIDQGVQQGLLVPHWAWGSTWIDYNNDTHQDLYVTTASPNPLTPPVTNFFFQNEGNGSFVLSNGLFTNNPSIRSYAVARGDINNDGYYDLVVHNQYPNDVSLWENSGGSNNFIKISLEGTTSNSFAIGSWIKVYAGGNTYTQFTLCGENYMSQNSQHHIFGLGDYTVVDSIQVIYPSGHTDTYYDVDVNQSVNYIEGETYLVNIEHNDTLDLCEGDSIILNAGVHSNYEWNTGVIGQSITADTTGIYSVTVTNEYGVSATTQVEIVFSPNPSILTYLTHVSCAGADNGSIDLQNQNTAPAASVSWSNGMNGPLVEGLGPGSFEYIFTDTNGCMATGNITVNEPLPLIFETFFEPETIGNDASILIFASGGTLPYSYWLNGDSVPSNQISGLSNGTYQINVMDANGCAATAEVTLGPTSARDFEKTNRFRLYPNPSRDDVFLETDFDFLDIRIDIFSVDGRHLTSEKFRHMKQIHLKFNLSAGTYMMVVTTSDIKDSFKLTIY